MERMLAARLHVPSRTLRLEEVPRPQPDPGEIPVKVEAARGVPLRRAPRRRHPHLAAPARRHRHPRPRGLRHRAEVGDGVTAWTPGQRVVLYAGESRDGGTYTRGVDYDGGWAEYALSAAGALTALPDAIPFEQGAIIPDAVSTPWGATTDTGGVRPGEAVGVWGVGGLGVHAVQVLRAVGPSGPARSSPSTSTPPPANAPSRPVPTSPSTPPTPLCGTRCAPCPAGRDPAPRSTSRTYRRCASGPCPSSGRRGGWSWWA